MSAIERLLKKYKLGKFSQPTVDYSGKILSLEVRLLNIEKALGIKDSATVQDIEQAVQVITPISIDNNKKGKRKKRLQNREILE